VKVLQSWFGRAIFDESWVWFAINRCGDLIMNHKGVEYTLTMTTVPGVWKWQFKIGDEIKTGKTETKIDLLAIRRVQSRIDRELKKIAASR
jgi:hypothetical protein